MNKVIVLAISFLFTTNGIAQSFSTTASSSFDIRKKIEPPLLEFAESPHFIDSDGNKAINANEKCKLIFKLKNTGKGDALNLNAVIKTSGNRNGIIVNSLQPLSNVGKSGGVQAFEIPISSDINTVDGMLNIDLSVEEPNGFGPEKVSMQISTRKFLAPEVKIVDYAIFSGTGNTNLELKKPFSLQVLVQNLGQGEAKNVSVKLQIPDNVFLTNGELLNSIDKLAPGEKKSIEYELIMNNKFSGTVLPIKIGLSEFYKNYAENWDKDFTLNQALAQQKIVIQSEAETRVEIVQASLRSDVDKDIPVGLPKGLKKYALIIGCEDYSKFQTGLEKEVNVDFAENDAIVFSEYAQNTLGFPKEQIYTLINPTSSQIKQNIDKLIKAIEIEKGQAEILFYYSGHGLPDENTKEPYLIPVDVNGNNPQDGISLNDLYAKLSKLPTQKCTVVLDACFSGGARNKELVALKGIKIKPKMDAVPKNIVVFTSSKGSESSAVFREKQHGYFTYFLLKNLKEFSGNINFATLSENVNYQVSKEVLKIGKTQTPEVIPGTEIGDKWKSMTW